MLATGSKTAIRDGSRVSTDELPAAQARGKSAYKEVGAVGSAIRILQYLAALGQPARLTQISRDLKLNTSTCLNILRTLAEFNFVQVDAASKSYTLGWGVPELARAAFTPNRITEHLRALMRDMAHRNRVTVTLWNKISDDHMQLMLQAESTAAMRLFFEVGQRLPVYVGAMGRIMAAYSELKPSELKRRFSKLRWQSPITFDEYMAGAEDARAKGWTADEGNFIAGTLTISVPIFDAAGEVTRVCSATTLMDAYGSIDIATIVADLKELSRQISVATAPAGQFNPL